MDATSSRFLAPPDMADEIRAACRESGAAGADRTLALLIRCCLESLALAYRHTLDEPDTHHGAAFDVIHIVGGGSQNRVLNQWAADACGLPVVAGPGEVTALGNVLAQLVASGAVTDWAEARQVSRRSAACEEHIPNPSAQAAWDERAARWERLRGRTDAVAGGRAGSNLTKIERSCLARPHFGSYPRYDGRIRHRR